MEGISQEAIALAGHLKLNKLIVFWDNNNISIDGAVSLSDSTDQVARFQASGWNTSHVDGHDPEAIAAAIEAAQTFRPADADRLPRRPSASARRPRPAPTRRMARRSAPTRSPARARRSAGMRQPFEIPADILDAWRRPARLGAKTRNDWEKRLAAAEADMRAEFERRMPATCRRTSTPPSPTTRRSSPPTSRRSRPASRREMALEVINGVVPETIGGSADLTGSNNTKTSQTKADHARRLRRPLRPLRHPRARHGGGDERHGAAWRPHPLWRHLPVLLRLCAPGDAPRLADGHPLDLRHDARFDRAWRGRPDPPAGRASRRAARHPEPHRLPPGRRDGNRRMLAARAGIDEDRRRPWR